MAVSVLSWIDNCSVPLNYPERKENPTDPVYEQPDELKLQEVDGDPAALCKLQKNIAYEIPPPRIKTAKNEAYGTILDPQSTSWRRIWDQSLTNHDYKTTLTNDV